MSLICLLHRTAAPTQYSYLQRDNASCSPTLTQRTAQARADPFKVPHSMSQPASVPSARFLASHLLPYCSCIGSSWINLKIPKLEPQYSRVCLDCLQCEMIRVGTLDSSTIVPSHSHVFENLLCDGTALESKFLNRHTSSGL